MVNDNESTPTDDLQSPFNEADKTQVTSPVPVDIETPVERALTLPLSDSIELPRDNYKKKSPLPSPSNDTELANSLEKESDASARSREVYRWIARH
jgi:hypothetical protein